MRLQGVLTSIVSNRNPYFTSSFWAKFQELLATTLNLSTSAHPQTNELSKRVIQVLEDMLRVSTLNFKDKWIDSVSDAELATITVTDPRLT
jgi:hypothetical protein